MNYQTKRRDGSSYGTDDADALADRRAERLARAEREAYSAADLEWERELDARLDTPAGRAFVTRLFREPAIDVFADDEQRRGQKGQVAGAEVLEPAA